MGTTLTKRARNHKIKIYYEWIKKSHATFLSTMLIFASMLIFSSGSFGSCLFSRHAYFRKSTVILTDIRPLTHYKLAVKNLKMKRSGKFESLCSAKNCVLTNTHEWFTPCMRLDRDISFYANAVHFFLSLKFLILGWRHN